MTLAGADVHDGDEGKRRKRRKDGGEKEEEAGTGNGKE